LEARRIKESIHSGDENTEAEPKKMKLPRNHDTCGCELDNPESIPKGLPGNCFVAASHCNSRKTHDPWLADAA